MKLTTLLNESKELLQIVGEKMIESPKPTLYVSAYSFAVGMSSFIDWFSEALPKMAVLAGFAGVIVLARLNLKKTRLTEAETVLKDIEAETARIDAENARIENRILLEKLKNMGVELRREDDKGHR